jgi:hypothetical protein
VQLALLEILELLEIQARLEQTRARYQEYLCSVECN